MRLLRLVVVLAGCAASGRIGYAAEAASAGEIVVRVGSAQVLGAVTIVPVHATMRVCASCAAELVPASLRVVSDGQKVRLNDARVADELLLQGSIRMEANGQKSVAAGRWRIESGVDGLHVTVVLPSERYVKAVLMGESAAEPAEALKAQAVVARTFALMNLKRHADADLCDSTHCQALRLDRVPEAIERAVDETAGETLWFGARRAELFFTQSCGGATATWPGATKPWLVNHADPYCERIGSHWRAAIAEGDLRRALNAEGWKFANALRGIRVVQRDKSGRTTKLMVDGVNVDAPAFRFAVGRQLGWNQIRSDLYEVKAQDGRFVFEGKGFGHGVGLCQFGAREMAQEGINYRQILAFHFPKTAVRVEPNDTGWRTWKSGALMVRAVEHVPPVTVPDGVDVSALRVTVYPTTELFRQATGEPGWVLGSTKGNTIALQPVAVMERHGGAQRVMRHELMHASIEAQSAASTPLWLREGLAEYLTGDLGGGVMPLGEMERALVAPRNQKESQDAHNAAAAKVRALVQANGLDVVWRWVRSGRVPLVQ